MSITRLNPEYQPKSPIKDMRAGTFNITIPANGYNASKDVSFSKPFESGLNYSVVLTSHTWITAFSSNPFLQIRGNTNRNGFTAYAVTQSNQSSSLTLTVEYLAVA